jgi:hypothetical protein
MRAKIISVRLTETEHNKLAEKAVAEGFAGPSSFLRWCGLRRLPVKPLREFPSVSISVSAPTSNAPTECDYWFGTEEVMTQTANEPST